MQRSTDQIRERVCLCRVFWNSKKKQFWAYRKRERFWKNKMLVLCQCRCKMLISPLIFFMIFSTFSCFWLGLVVFLVFLNVPERVSAYTTVVVKVRPVYTWKSWPLFWYKISSFGWKNKWKTKITTWISIYTRNIVSKYLLFWVLFKVSSWNKFTKFLRRTNWP